MAKTCLLADRTLRPAALKGGECEGEAVLTDVRAPCSDPDLRDPEGSRKDESLKGARRVYYASICTAHRTHLDEAGYLVDDTEETDHE